MHQMKKTVWKINHLFMYLIGFSGNRKVGWQVVFETVDIALTFVTIISKETNVRVTMMQLKTVMKKVTKMKANQKMVMIEANLDILDCLVMQGIVAWRAWDTQITVVIKVLILPSWFLSTLSTLPFLLLVFLLIFIVLFQLYLLLTLYDIPKGLQQP